MRLRWKRRSTEPAVVVGGVIGLKETGLLYAVTKLETDNRIGDAGLYACATISLIELDEWNRRRRSVGLPVEQATKAQLAWRAEQ